MKLLTPLLAAGLLATCGLPRSAQAADTQAQTLAREALEKKLRELQGQPSAPVTSAPAPTVIPSPTPAVAPPPATPPTPTPPAPPPAPKPAAPVVDPNRPGPVVPPASVSHPAPPPPPPPKVVVAPPTTPPPPAPAPPPKATFAPIGVDTPEVAKAREAMRQKMTEVQGTTTPPPPPAIVGKPSPTVAQVPKKEAQKITAFPPIAGPPVPLSATKQQKLDDLLNQYRADQITPQQYHDARAKILAEK